VNDRQLLDKPILAAAQGICIQRHTFSAELLADLGLNDAGSAEPNQCVRVDGLGENNRQDQRAVKRKPPKSCGRATCYMHELGDRGSITGLGHRLCP